MRGMLVTGVAVGLAGCGRRGGDGPGTEPPPVEAAGLARCTLAPSQLRPLVVEWSGADRGALELQLRRGVVAVRYEGCTLRILPDCAAPGEYAYSGFTRKRDSVHIRSVDELYTEIPVGAGRLAAQLERVGEMHVDMTLVGEHRAARGRYTADELVGVCGEATHVLAAAQVGAFAFYAGADSRVVAIGAEEATLRDTINSDGSPAACEAATLEDRSAPAQCGALLRLELAPVLPARPRSVAVADEPPAEVESDPRPVVPPPTVTPAPPRQLPDDYLTPRRKRGYRDPSLGLGISAAVTGLVALAGIATIAAGIAGVSGDMKTGRDTSDSKKVTRTGIGLTVGGAALSGLFFGLLYSDVGCEGPRMRLRPSFGRGYGGMALTVNF
jgi:hypothetical protein